MPRRREAASIEGLQQASHNALSVAASHIASFLSRTHDVRVTHESLELPANASLEDGASFTLMLPVHVEVVESR